MTFLKESQLKDRLDDAVRHGRVYRSLKEHVVASTREIKAEARAVEMNITALVNRPRRSSKPSDLWLLVEEEAEPLLPRRPSISARQVQTTVVGKDVGDNYRLKAEDTNQELAGELQNLYTWMTQPSFAVGDGVVGPVTAKNYLLEVRGALGWLLNVRLPQGDWDRVLANATAGRPASERAKEEDPSERRRSGLRLRSLVPSPGAEGAELVYEWLQWSRSARRSAASSERQRLTAMIKLAKFVHKGEAALPMRLFQGPTAKRRAFDSMGLIQQLRELKSDAVASARASNSATDAAKKEVTWPTFLMCVKRLHEEYQNITREASARRRPKQVAVRLQRLLVFSILAVFPDRQRTLRELEIDRTLVKMKGGLWAIKHGAGDFKTGATFGERARVPLPRSISNLITVYVSRWRQYMTPAGHNFLFVRENSGEPYVFATDFAKMFAAVMFRLTGKKTTPHVLRDSVVTFMRNLPDISDKMLESLALLMGHSLETQRDVYDKSTADQKLAPALEMMKSSGWKYAPEA